jgi:hypothetical protein
MTATITDLLTGIAETLADAGIGSWPPPTNGVYPSDQVGIVLGVIPQQPDQTITLTGYAVRDASLENDSTVAVQVRLRGTEDPRVVQDRSGAVFNALQDLAGVSFGSIYLVLAARQSSLPMGQDENRRWLWSDNYYCQVAWPTLHRPD